MDESPGLPTFLHYLECLKWIPPSKPIISPPDFWEPRYSQSGDGRVSCAFRLINPLSKIVDTGAFSLLYSFGEAHKPFDLSSYLQAKQVTEAAIESSSVSNCNMMKVNNLTWSEHRNRKLYIDYFLIGNVNLFQQWLLRTVKSIEDMRLEFLEKGQTQRIVQEREWREPAMEADDTYPIRHLYLPDNFSNSLALWKSKLLDVQAIFSRRFLSRLLSLSARTQGGKYWAGWDLTSADYRTSLLALTNQGFSILQIFLSESSINLPTIWWNISWKMQKIYLL